MQTQETWTLVHVSCNHGTMNDYQTEKATRARAYFLEGYTCSQAIVLAFAEEMQMDTRQLLLLSAPFGGGMGRLREVCGAVSGAFMVLGALYGTDIEKNHAAKAALYARVQTLAASIRAQNGSIICRELLAGIATDVGGAPEARTSEYYKKRPCPQIIADVAYLLAEYLQNNPLGKEDTEV